MECLVDMPSGPIALWRLSSEEIAKRCAHGASDEEEVGDLGVVSAGLDELARRARDPGSLRQLLLREVGLQSCRLDAHAERPAGREDPLGLIVVHAPTVRDSRS